jgi:hypothetical protein
MTARHFALVLVLGASILAGCASSVSRNGPPGAAAPTPAARTLDGKPAQEVTLTMSADAKALLADNLKFDQNRLLDTVKRALAARNLLATAGDAPPLPDNARNVEILVKDFRARSNFTAVMFGFMAGADSVTGDVIVKDGTGKELSRFQVSASYALGGLAGGQDEARMGWLYEKFAELTLNELTEREQNR